MNKSVTEAEKRHFGEIVWIDGDEYVIVMLDKTNELHDLAGNDICSYGHDDCYEFNNLISLNGSDWLYHISECEMFSTKEESIKNKKWSRFRG